MKIKTENRVAQIAIDVLVIMGIIVVGAIIQGIAHFYAHKEKINTSAEVTSVQGAADSLINNGVFFFTKKNLKIEN